MFFFFFFRLAEVKLNMPWVYVNTLENSKTLSPTSGTEEQMWVADSRDHVYLSGKIMGTSLSLDLNSSPAHYRLYGL